VLRTPRGRVLGDHGWRHIGLTAPAGTATQLDLMRDSGGDEDA
jgi:Holliday junction DNA helicase RuvB